MKDLKPQDEFRIGVKVRAYNHTLHSALEALGSSRAEQAEKLGIKAAKLSSIVCLRDYPRADLRLTFSIVLGIPEDTLFPEQIAGIRITKAPDPIVLSLEDFATISALELEMPRRENAFEPDLAEPIAKALSKLSERDARVLAMRFGLGDGENLTLEEIGRREGVTRDRIRQIESRALSTIRARLSVTHLVDYLEPWQEGVETQPKDISGLPQPEGTICQCRSGYSHMSRWEKGQPTLEGCGSVVHVPGHTNEICGVTGHYRHCMRRPCPRPSGLMQPTE